MAAPEIIPTVVKTLSNKYARLRGEYEYAERDAEFAEGLTAIDAVTAKILKRKREIHKQLDAIEIVIHIFDPRWDFAAVKPIRPMNKLAHAKGSISRLAYKALRENNNKPMTVAQIAKVVAAKLGQVNPSQRAMTMHRTAVTNAFMSRQHDTVEMLEGLPRRWMLRNFEPVLSADASSSTLSKPARSGVPPQRAAAG